MVIRLNQKEEGKVKKGEQIDGRRKVILEDVWAQQFVPEWDLFQIRKMLLFARRGG